MFLAVIAGYVLAASLAFCGVANLVSYISEADRSMGYSPFLAGLVVQLWPLVAAVVILLLIQVASIAEKIHIYQKMLGMPSADEAPPAPVRPKRKPAEDSEGGYFRTYESAAPRGVPAAPVPPAPTAPHAAAPETEPSAGGSPTEPSRKRDDSGLSYFKVN